MEIAEPDGSLVTEYVFSAMSGSFPGGTSDLDRLGGNL